MGLEAVDYYDPPNFTYPFGSYICVVDIDKGTGGQVSPLRGGRRLRQHHQPDDRRGPDPRRPDDGPRPGVVRGDPYDENGNNLAGTFMDYLLPTAMETPAWETGKTITPLRIIRWVPRGG